MLVSSYFVSADEVGCEQENYSWDSIPYKSKYASSLDS